MKILSDKQYKKKIQSTYAEGQRDILLGQKLLRESRESLYISNYTEYKQQLDELYEMYYCKAELGMDTTGTIIDLRSSIIMGDGISVISKNSDDQKWIKEFLDIIGIDSVNLYEFIKHGELEGKQLLKYKLIIDTDKTRKLVVEQVLRQEVDYKIFGDKRGNIKQLYINDKPVPSPEAYIVVKLAGKPGDYDCTPSRIYGIIQQIKNYDRAVYDLRAANHHFGFPTPAVEYKTGSEAEAGAKAIRDSKWEIGDTFASTGKMYYPEPPKSYETLEKEASLNAKIISCKTGLPVHWLGWTELMSNRSTARELNELLLMSHKQEKQIWQKKIKDIVIKAMELAIDFGIDNVRLVKDFSIELPYSGGDYIESIKDTWLELQQKKVISMKQLRQKTPGIDPDETEEMVKAEEEENLKMMKKMGLMNQGGQENGNVPNQQANQKNTMSK